MAGEPFLQLIGSVTTGRGAGIPMVRNQLAAAISAACCASTSCRHPSQLCAFGFRLAECASRSKFMIEPYVAYGHPTVDDCQCPRNLQVAISSRRIGQICRCSAAIIHICPTDRMRTDQPNPAGSCPRRPLAPTLDRALGLGEQAATSASATRTPVVH